MTSLLKKIGAILNIGSKKKKKVDEPEDEVLPKGYRPIPGTTTKVYDT